MRTFRLEPAANRALDDIMDYTSARWDDAQAESYIDTLFEEFAAIADRKVLWRRIPASFDIDGYVRRCGSHLIYWRCGADDVVRIVAVLHERMHQSLRLRDALDGDL